MKILLDIQGTQSNSRGRGIGRYSLAMAQAFAREASQHELWLVLNGREDASSESLIKQFSGLIAPENFLVNELPAGIAGCNPANRVRAHMASAGQAGLFHAVDADCVWHSSLFEGWGDDSVATLGNGAGDRQHAATFYDLIPLLYPARYLQDIGYSRWYHRRLQLMKRCGLLLALSESSRREAIDILQVRPESVAVVHGAADLVFRPVAANEACREGWRRGWGLQSDFVMYAGGFDAHKNVETLIAAFAALPAGVRKQHTLVLAGRCDDDVQQRLRLVASKHGLPKRQLIMTGGLDDQQLARLYSSCTVFIAPSLHEGLGLPPLEAMACGAAVIGSDTASLPEVIGRRDALFDPRSQASITAKLHLALSNSDFRASLKTHAAEQSRRFTWSGSARLALAAIEQHGERNKALVRRSPRPRLLYVSPLPPLRSGIADYSARLLRELACHYQIDVVVDQPEVLDPWVQANFPIRPLSWFLQHSRDVRILYHFGNSPFHAHMFGMLQQRPGVVVLHDSLLGAARNWMSVNTGNPADFSRLLYEHHGFAALADDQTQGRDVVLDKWPVNRDVIEGALGIIVHSDYARAQARRFHVDNMAQHFHQVPFPQQVTHADRTQARRLLGLSDSDYLVCSFGMLAPTKLNERLLSAWLQSSLAGDAHCQLIFVGEPHGGAYGRALSEQMAGHAARKRIRITGFVAGHEYRDYLAAADVAVQLRKDSRGETSAAIFDVLAQGVPLIINAHGSAAELPDTVAVQIPDCFTDDELAAALESLRRDDRHRMALAAAARCHILEYHHPAAVAARYGEVIEACFESSSLAQVHRVEGDAARVMDDDAATVAELHQLRALMALNLPRLGLPRLFVDVTAIERSHLHSGIERVVRGVLSALLRLDQTRYRVEPVRMENGAFRHATGYGLQLLDLSLQALPEDEAQPRRGDVLLGLDWVADTLPANDALLQAWRVRGVRMLFVVYDLLPVRHPDWFPPGIAAMHAHWLQCIGRFADGLLCISRHVADDARSWFEEHAPSRSRELALGYFYPGSDPAATRPTRGLPSEAATLRGLLSGRSTFLMVGTIEPRKGHAMVLDAFEQAWRAGVDACLVVVGRHGWMSDAVTTRLRAHGETGRRLFWLEQASDELLEQLYGTATALVAASQDEGFGLPLVEAARRGLPVIARDIPVFHEVASSFATYFDGDDVESLVQIITHAAAGLPPCSGATSPAVLSWQATTDAVWDMLNDPRHLQWLPPWRPV